MFKIETLRRDFAASIVVFLVALPLSLGIAVASGASAEAGIISAVIGGVVVGLLAGAPLQISGPAAGLTVLVFGYIQNFGFETTCFIVTLAGIGQVILGLLRVSRLSLMIAPAVIHGMLAGIGILISLAQFHVLLGHSPYSSGPLNIIHIIDSLENFHLPPLSIGLLTIAIIVGWKKFLPKIDSIIPGSLVAVLVATFLAQYLRLELQTVQLQSVNSLFKFTLTLPPLEQWPQLIISAVVLLIVASAESLLCAIATDKLHTGPRANLDKELVAQGVGNITASALGGLPITGVIVRSSANIGSGAQTRVSAILHGVWVLLFVLIASSYISLIPLSALSGLLIYVGIKLVKVDQIRHLKKYGDTTVYFATFIGVVLFGLLNGIIIGVAITIFKLHKSFGKIQIESSEKDRTLEVRINGALTFLAAPQVSKFLSSIPSGKHVIFHFELTHIDLTGLEIIRDWKYQYTKTGGSVEKPNLDDWILK
jgi:carbonic anhydrase